MARAVQTITGMNVNFYSAFISCIDRIVFFFQSTFFSEGCGNRAQFESEIMVDSCQEIDSLGLEFYLIKQASHSHSWKY